MDDWMIGLLVIGGMVSFIGGIIYLGIRLEKVRREKLEKFASELSLDFHPTGLEELQSLLQEFKLFNLGRSRKMTNVILGETEIIKVAIFDYSYTTGSGKEQSTANQTVVAMESNELNIPSFTMRPEHLFDWVGSAFGFQDIDFDDHPQFSKLFVLKATDESSVRDFFDQELLDFFTERKGITFEGIPGRFIYFKAGRRTKVEDMKSYLEEGYSVYSAFMARLARQA
ncbi:MAG: hypothetical protein VX438_17890 [Planctomycetota bacterium]|nr:hypothetical protein [Planctomycetota bacterium]